MAETLYRTGFALEKPSSQSSSEDLDEALDILTEALRIRRLHLEACHPDLAETLFTLASVHHGPGNSHGAIKTLSVAIQSREVLKTTLNSLKEYG